MNADKRGSGKGDRRFTRS